MNTVTVGFNTTMGQMTEMSQQKKTPSHKPAIRGKKTKNFSCEIFETS